MAIGSYKGRGRYRALLLALLAMCFSHGASGQCYSFLSGRTSLTIRITNLPQPTVTRQGSGENTFTTYKYNLAKSSGVSVTATSGDITHTVSDFNKFEILARTGSRGLDTLHFSLKSGDKNLRLANIVLSHTSRGGLHDSAPNGLPAKLSTAAWRGEDASAGMMLLGNPSFGGEIEKIENCDPAAPPVIPACWAMLANKAGDLVQVTVSQDVTVAQDQPASVSYRFSNPSGDLDATIELGRSAEPLPPFLATKDNEAINGTRLGDLPGKASCKISSTILPPAGKGAIADDVRRLTVSLRAFSRYDTAEELHKSVLYKEALAGLHSALGRFDSKKEEDRRAFSEIAPAITGDNRDFASPLLEEILKKFAELRLPVDDLLADKFFHLYVQALGARSGVSTDGPPAFLARPEYSSGDPAQTTEELLIAAGDSQHESNNLRLATFLYEKVLQLDKDGPAKLPDDARERITRSLGYCLFRMGDKEEAEKYLPKEVIAREEEALLGLVPAELPAEREVHQRPGGTAELALGKTVAGALARGQAHSYRISAHVGELIQIALDELGVSLEVALFDPLGQRLLEANAAGSAQERVSISHIAVSAGDYQLEVRLADRGAAAGRYQITLQQLRRAMPQDDKQITAQAAFFDGSRFFGKVTEDSYRWAVSRFAVARSIYQEIGMRAEEAVTLNAMGRFCVSFAPGEAREHYQRALAIYRETRNREGEGITLRNLGSAHDVLSEHRQAIEYYQQALAVFRETKDRESQGSPLDGLGNEHSALGRFEPAIGYYEQAVAAYHETQDRAEEGRVLNNLGIAYYRLGRFAKAIACYQQALAIAGEVKDGNGKVRALNNLLIVYYRMGDYEKSFASYLAISAISRHETEQPAGERPPREYEEALEYHEHMLEVFRDVQDRTGEAAALRNVGIAYCRLGRCDQAIHYLEQALGMGRELADRGIQAAALLGLGTAYDSLGQDAKAIALLEQALAISREIKDPAIEGAALNGLGAAHSSLDQYEEAVHHFQQALELLRALRERAGQSYALDNLGNVHARLGDAKAAIGSYQQALAIYRETQDRVGQGQELRNLGDAYSSLGQHEKAADCYQQALAIRRDIHPGGPSNTQGPNPYVDSPAFSVFRRPPQDPLSRDDHEIEYLEQALTTSRRAAAAAAVAAGGQPQLMVQLGHSRPVTSVVSSPDGRYVLTGSGDGTARLWEAATGTELRRFEGHTGAIYAVAFSPDGSYVLTGSRDHTARLWAAATGEEVRRLNGHAEPVNAVAFSPDGRYVLTGSGDGSYPLTSRDNSTRLWDAATGREVRRFDGQTGVVLCVAFSPDGKYALAGGTDGTARLLRVETGEEVRRFHGHSSSVSSAAFSPDGRFVLTGSTDKTARLWQTDNGAEVRRFEGHSSEVSSVAFSPDGRAVATASWDQTVRLWAAASGAELRRFAVHSMAHAVAFSPDGRYVLTGLWEMTARLWDAATGREVQRFAGNAAPIAAVAFSPDGRYVLTAGGPVSEGGDNTARLWELETGREVRRFVGHSEQVHAVAFSPDGRYVLTGSGLYSDHTARLWEAATGKEVRRFEGYNQSLVMSVAFSPDAKYVLTGCDAAILWETATGRQVRELPRSVYHLNSVAFSPDGRYVLGGRSDYTARLWEVETGREVRIFRGHSDEVSAVAFSPDGRYVLTGSWDDTARLWEAATGKEVRRLEGHAAGVTAVAWSPDGKFLLTAGSDMTARLWAAATGEQLRTFSGHSGQIEAVAFSPDGRQALTGGADATTRLWDVATSQQLSSLISFSSGAWAVVDANGHFDASNVEETTGLHWVMADEPMKTYALELFMRDYYEPRLLPRLRNGERFHTRSISELNRAHPEVAVTALAPDPEHPGLVTVTVKVKRAISDHQRDAQGGPRRTEVYQVRLFRDGQIVAQEPDRLPGEAVPPAASDSEREQIRQRQLQLWRDHALIRPSQRVKLEPDGSMSVTFSKIRLPRRDVAGIVEFSAYAFNEDRVKSNTDRVYAVSKDAAGSALGGKTFLMPSGLPPRRGRAYVIAVGVNRYQNAAWDLQFAANDARAAHGDLTQSLKSAGEFAGVIEETLISDDRVEVGEQRATKENLHSAIAAIAREATPEDLVLIYYAGHGYAGGDGQYYFFTERTGAGSQQEITPELLANSISSDEISDWLRAVDAGDMVLIVDACQSAGTVSGEEGEAFKPGPMGNRGLGQLAYDKGMRILAASQADDVALEVARLQHGFLTYALLKDGLEDQKARPAGGAADELTMKQWLEYGEKRVPVLQEALVNGKLQELLDQERAARGVQLVGAPGARRRFQKPALFDFARSKREVLLARPGAKAGGGV